MKPKRFGYCDGCEVALPLDRKHNTRYCSSCRPPYVRKREKPVDEQGNHVCETCRKPFNYAHPLTRFCFDCGKQRSKDCLKRRLEQRPIEGYGQQMAHRFVSLAVAQGFLPPVDTCKCVDCGSKAQAYDHRDYNRPLDVDPVCDSCNSRRGAAIPFKPALERQKAA